MKKNMLLSSLSSILVILSIVFVSFKNQQSGLFYYAFKEKILLEVVPQKLVVRYKSADDAKTGIADLQRLEISKTVDYKDDRTAVIDLLKADTAIVIRNLQNNQAVTSYQPLYRSVAEKLEVSVTDELLVKFNGDARQTAADSIIKKYNLTLLQKGEVFNTYTVAKFTNTLQTANAIQESGLAEFSHPNFYIPVVLNQVPNDQYFNYQWNLHNTGGVINDGHTGTPNADINAPEAWPITMGSSSIVVAVLDEGLTSNHPDLPNTRQVRLAGSNFSLAVPGSDPSPVGDGNHGNACSGIIAATRNNSEGIAGIAPNCKIMPVKILNPSANAGNIANAITFAKNNGAHILSNSWGFSTDNPNFVPAIVATIRDAVTTGRGGLGCVVVFAAGNTANFPGGTVGGFVNFPANVNIPGVLTVGASDRYDLKAQYSPLSNPASPNNQIVDLVAPSHRAYPCQIAGETFEIWSMDIPGTAGYNSWHGSVPACTVPPAVGSFLPASGINFQSYTGRMGGTSAACPQVAAAAALLLSLNARLTQQQVFDILTQNADKVGGYAYNSAGFSNELGFGRLDLYRSVLKAGPDLFMKDQAWDAGFEPNPDNASTYYESPDIWVRNTNDGLAAHQNPEAGQINYVYVKVRNRGYLPSAGAGNRLKLYWAKASVGLSWTFPWTGASYNCAGIFRSVGGAIGDQSISAIAAGGFTTYVFPWNPPKPSDYAPCFGTDISHFCLLARIETLPTTPYGMAFAETTDLGQNVKKNNNIVWKNVSVVNLLPDRSSAFTSVLLTGSKLLGRTFTTINLRFASADTALLKAAKVDIDLGNFTNAWLEKGGKVDGAQIFKDNQGKVLIRLTADKGTIYGIPIGTEQIGAVTVAVTPVEFPEGNTYGFNIEQWDGQTAIGGERFDISFDKNKNESTQSSTTSRVNEASFNPKLKAFQNGTQLIIQTGDDKAYNVTVSNSVGQVMNTFKMTTQASVPVYSYQAGVYIVRLTDTKGNKAYSIKTLIK